MYSELIMTSLFFFTLLQQPSRDGNLITHKICLHHWSSVTIQTHNMMAKRERVWKGRIETRNLKSTQPTSNNNKHKSFSSTQSLSISYFLSRQKFQFHGVLNIYVSGFFLFILLVVHRSSFNFHHHHHHIYEVTCSLVVVYVCFALYVDVSYDEKRLNERALSHLLRLLHTFFIPQFFHRHFYPSQHERILCLCYVFVSCVLVARNWIKRCIFQNKFSCSFLVVLCVELNVIKK